MNRVMEGYMEREVLGEFEPDVIPPGAYFIWNETAYIPVNTREGSEVGHDGQEENVTRIIVPVDVAEFESSDELFQHMQDDFLLVRGPVK